MSSQEPDPKKLRLNPSPTPGDEKGKNWYSVDETIKKIEQKVIKAPTAEVENSIIHDAVAQENVRTRKKEEEVVITETDNDTVLANQNGSRDTGNVILQSIGFSSKFEQEEFKNELLKIWQGFEHFEDKETLLTVKPTPFRFGEIRNFIDNVEFLENFIVSIPTIELDIKTNDLYQFSQSNDLKTVGNTFADALIEFLSSKVLPVLTNITGFSLNSKLDLFLSEYTQTDFLLCHDDELESRRIAFVLYLSKDWKPEYGGSLDLYSSTDENFPDKVVTEIIPEFNKFVFFEVNSKSFHRVSEVVKSGVKRYAVSGWFYGDPLPRPPVELPKDEGVNLHESIIKKTGQYDHFVDATYISDEIYNEINEQLGNHSEVLLPSFMKHNVYSALCSDIVDMDLNKEFKPTGPLIASFFDAGCFGPPTVDQNEDFKIESSVQGMIKFFYSEEFMQFMDKISEFPFSKCPLAKVTSSIRKYSHGSYSLLNIGGAKQTGENDSELKDSNAGTSAKSSSNETPSPDTPVKNQSKVEEEEGYPEDTLCFVDLIYFFGSNWDEMWGGLTVYHDTDGEQLVTVTPQGNCLAVVVRPEKVNSYMNYVNCLAGEEVFFTFNMTFAFGKQ